MVDIAPPRKLVWTNALFGVTGALFVFTLFMPKVSMLGSCVMYSAMLLGLYRSVLLLVMLGGEAACKRMRKWKH